MGPAPHRKQTGAVFHKSNWPWWIRTTINGSKVPTRSRQGKATPVYVEHLAHSFLAEKALCTGFPRPRLSDRLPTRATSMSVPRFSVAHTPLDPTSWAGSGQSEPPPGG